MAKAALKAGGRFKSAVCDAQVMVIKAPAGEFELGCGGQAMIGPAEATSGAAPDPALAGGTLVGKRYVNEDESLELLCTKGGAGTLTLDGTALDVKQAKQLPSSD
ncbi:hypothetical protein [Polycyclovorans algicola]|uniref:hypothetical protein n=1 Tax=Polycyclovorans algicola TaxID=616992 RepID=UPI0004A7202B|nr:hypothetical protein [Polycyclovorans algicola]